MTVTSTKMIQSSSAWLTIVSDFFIKCASFVCLYPFMQLALYISVVRPPFHLFCGGIWAPNLMGKVYFWRILASSTGDYFLAIIRRLSPTRQQLARRLVGEANSGSKTIRSKSVRISKTHAHIYSQGKYNYTYFDVTATLRIIIKKRYEHQMFTRWQFEMTSTFL